MKPVIKIIDSADGVIKFSKAELEKLLDDVYHAGYQDGYNAKPQITTVSDPISTPIFPNNWGYPYPVYYGTGYDPDWWKKEVTCCDDTTASTTGKTFTYTKEADVPGSLATNSASDNKTSTTIKLTNADKVGNTIDVNSETDYVLVCDHPHDLRTYRLVKVSDT